MSAYVLIMTLVFYTYGGYQNVSHIEHEYTTAQACHAAYDIARDQIAHASGRAEVQGTCLKVDK